MIQMNPSAKYRDTDAEKKCMDSKWGRGVWNGLGDWE